MSESLIDYVLEDTEKNELYNEDIEYDINELINEHYPVIYMDIHNTYHAILDTPGKNHGNKNDLELLLKKFILDVNKDGYIKIHHVVLFLMYNLDNDIIRFFSDGIKHTIKKDLKVLQESGKFYG